MTLFEALDRIDAVKPNTFDRSEKIYWIAELEWTLKRDLYDTHDGPQVRFNGLTEYSDGRTPLTAPEPFSEIYVHYVSAMIDHCNRETAAYANSMALFNGLYEEYWRWYNRRYRPRGERIRFFTPHEPRTSADALKMTGSDPETQEALRRRAGGNGGDAP